MRVVERLIDRSELYSADELILCGTGVGVAWVRSVDHRVVGDGRPGEAALAAISVYDDVVRGRNSSYDVELHPIYGTASVTEAMQVSP